MFSRYQEENKIANMMELDLLLFYKRKPIYDTTFYHKEIQDQVQTKYKSSREVPFIAPVTVSVAEY